MKQTTLKDNVNSHYTTHYYTRYKKETLSNRLFVKLVDRREPAFSYLRHHYPPGSTLLDIGCGNGNFLHHAETLFHCTGIDVSDPALKLAKQYTSQTKIIKRSIYHISKFPAQSFSIITCFDVLEHVVDLSIILAQISRLLKPNGTFVFTAPNYNSLGRKWRREKWLNYREISHLWFFDASEWSFLLKQSGFLPQKIAFDGLCDPPYTRFLPQSFQHFLLKIPTQAWSLVGLPLPEKLGENLMIISTMAPGMQNHHYLIQTKIANQRQYA